MSRLEPSRKPVKRSGAERSLEVQLGPLGGFEVRPTRLFVWGGGEREGHERIVSFGSPPQSLSSARRERELEARGVRVRTLGNPLMTVALAGVHVARQLAREADEDRATGSGSAGPGSAPARRSRD